MKKSEVKTCSGNELLVIQSLFMVGVTLSPINYTSSYQTHVIEVVKYIGDNLMVSFCKVFGYRWQFVTETTSIF